MNKYAGLLSFASLGLDVKKGDTEDDFTSWRRRAIYSMTGVMANAALYDIRELDIYRDEEEAEQDQELPANTIIHFKSKVKEIFCAYLEMYPEIGTDWAGSPDFIADVIYNQFLQAGMCYHRAGWISPVPFFKIMYGGSIAFIRGFALSQHDVLASGLGPYMKVPPPSPQQLENSLSPSQMYGWADQSLENLFAELCACFEHGEKANIDGIDLEYLSVDSFWKGYFSPEPTRDGNLSLARTPKNAEASRYYLYRATSKGISAVGLPGWRVHELEYFTLANAILQGRGKLPPILFRNDGNITYVTLQYLLPPSELSTLRFYSWPAEWKIANGKFSDFKRIVSTDVFAALKPLLEQQGCAFQEEKI